MSRSYVRVPPDGAGKRIYSNQFSVSGNTVEVQGINLVSGTNPEHIQEIDAEGSAYMRFTEGSPNLDAYTNLKASHESIVGVYEHSIDSYDDLFYTEEVSGGTYEFQIENSCVMLSVNTQNYSRCTRTTNRYHYYQNGVSFFCTFTVATDDSGRANNVRQWGLFDDNNGVFFELTGTTMNIVIRSTINSSFNEIRIPQSQWNVDKLDGTGISGVNIVPENAYQYWVSINWSKGVYKFGIFENARIVIHEYVSNSNSYTSIRTASLPVRINIENIGITNDISSLRFFSATVETEGYPDYTFWRFGDIGMMNKSITTNTPTLVLRPKLLLSNGYRNSVNSYPETLSVFSDQALKINMVSFVNDSLLTGATWSIESETLEADSGATAIDITSTDYWIMTTFYIAKNTATNFDMKPFFELNDEGILLAGDGTTQSCLGFIATTLESTGATIYSMDFSYRALF